MSEECRFVWSDENDTDHTCCLNKGSSIHDNGGHACTCGERIEISDWETEEDL